MARGQAWSMDLVIGVLIFLLAVGIIYSILSARSDDNTRSLKLQSEVVATKLTNDPTVLVTNGNRLSMTSLVGLAQRAETDYAGLKQELGVEHDFCIYLVDENGKLTYITDGSSNYTGIGPGRDDVNISGVRCGENFKIN